MSRLYLDNSATSFPKPPGVYEAMLRYGREIGASPARGHYAESREGARLIRQCRERLCRLIDGENPNDIIFTLNTTDALNVAIKGVVRRWRRAHPGRTAHVVTTALDHNSTLRPLSALREDGLAAWTCVPGDERTGLVDPSDLARAITPDTCLIAVVHASNVSGTLQDLAALSSVARRQGVLFLVDAAQSLGHVPLSVREAGIDLLAFPGHKGLMGPQGTGGLYVRPGAEEHVETTREGGTGHLSEQDIHPHDMPQKFEAGSHNTIGIVGLSESVAWILEQSVPSLRAHELAIIEAFLARLREGGARLSDGSGGVGPLSGLRLLGPTRARERVAVFALTHEALSPAEFAAALETSFGILVRSGLTCAPHAHTLFGTHPSQGGAGAFRLSFGAFNTVADAHRAADALAAICVELASNPA